jgi:hypothetical protein
MFKDPKCTQEMDFRGLWEVVSGGYCPAKYYTKFEFTTGKVGS